MSIWFRDSSAQRSIIALVIDSSVISSKIDDDSVSDIKWHGDGCTICKACTSVLTQLVKGKNIDYAKNLKKEELLSELGLDYLVKQSPVRIKCALLSLKSLKLGLYSYLASKIENSSSVDNLKEEASKLY